MFRFPWLIGPARAYELLYTGEIVSAQEAHRLGLVNRLAPAGGAVAAAVSFARTVAQGPALRSA